MSVSTDGAGNGALGGTAGIQSDPRQAATGIDSQGVDAKTGNTPGDDEKEEKLVKKRWQTYENARKFDEEYRKQIAIDRRYAAGTSDPSWAVSTNIIGAFIDILVSLLYARDPDVSVSKSDQVKEAGTAKLEDFPKTMELVISYLWRKGKLKKEARKAVRSILSTSEGWLKVFMVSEAAPNAEAYQTQLNDAKTMTARLNAMHEMIEEADCSPDELEVRMAEAAALEASLTEKLELAVERMLVIDFVPSENMQISSDVAQIADHLDAGWNGNEKFIPYDDVMTQFPRLTEDDLKHAKAYYQKGPKAMSRDLDNVSPQGQVTAETAQAFTSSTSNDGASKFLRATEMWDRKDRTVYSMIEGIKKWAKEPFAPPYPTSRFFPYFYCSFYEVDGERHPQSLSWRLHKLQDEYSSVRSNYRLLRQRAIPATMFDSTAIDDVEAQKITDGKLNELIGVRVTGTGKTLANSFAPKPVSEVDPRLFDVTLILSDMERVSGVQEALSAAASGPGNPKTATEANIEQSGTNARTGADRDNLEEMLTQLAQATGEMALQCIPTEEVFRICGTDAVWPFGMAIEDLFTMCEIEIEAGTTGKPRRGSDQQAWSQLLPTLSQYIKDINQAMALGDLPLVQALTAIVEETMLRFGDETDPMRFIPQAPPPGSPGSNPPPKPVPAPVTISLRGELDPVTAAMLAKPDLTINQQADIAARAAAAAQGQPGQSAPGGTPGAPGPGPNAPPQPPGPPHP